MEFKRIFNDGVHLIIGRIGAILVGFIHMVLLTRILSTEEVGKYSLFIMVVNFALTFGMNWVDASIIRHGREEFVKTKKINQSFWARVCLFLPLLIIFSLLSIIFSKSISNYIGIEQKLIVFVTLTFVFNSVLFFLVTLYQSIDKMKVSAYILFVQRSLFLISLILIYLNLLNFNSKLSLILIFLTLSFTLSSLYYLVTFNFKKVFPFTFNKRYFNKIWSYSWPQLIGFVGLYISNNIDLFVIRQYLSLDDVGIYSIAYNGFIIVTGTIVLIHTLFLPLIVEYKAKKNYFLIKKYIKMIPLLSLIWFVFVIIGLALSSRIITMAFSEKYISSIPVFKILLGSTIFYFISICFMPLINAFDLILYSQIFNVIKAIINVVADYLLIPKMGIIGGAYATLIATFFGLVSTLFLFYVNKTKFFKSRKVTKG